MSERAVSTGKKSLSDNTARQKSTAWVFAGGDFHEVCFDSALVAVDDIIVGVDHGIEHCLAAGLVPDVIMGDFDSVDRATLDDSRLLHVKRIAYPPRKNSSDLELALEWLSEVGIARAILMGVSGGRSDHHLINWMLPLQECWPFAIEMIDATVHALVLTPDRSFNEHAWVGQTITLVPMPEAHGVSTVGLEYALNNAHLAPGSTLGLSNIAVDETVKVSLSEGRLLVFRVNKDKMPGKLPA
ncbi:MAG: thiamine diphosphokinase [Granulosicoccus sp.]